MSDYYISPNGAGDRTGSNWFNAATINKLGGLVEKAGANDQILVRADQGSYHVTSQIVIDAGGAVGKPVVIRGVDGSGNAEQATIIGNRPAKYDGDSRAGNELFKLLDGADNLKFADLLVKDTGTAFRFGADLNRITIDNVDARNVTYFVNNLASGSEKTATVDKLTIRDVDVIGFSNKAITLGYDTHNVTIKNMTADMAGQTGELYPEGIHLTGTVHDVLIKDTTMANVKSLGGATSYWNGDGFATESNVHDIRFENTTAIGNTDAGYDLKSDDTVLVGALAIGNTRNYRFWGSASLIDSEGHNPMKQGGNSSQNQVWIGNSAEVFIKDSLFRDSDKDTIVFAGTEGSISFDDVNTYHAAGTRLSGLYLTDVNGWSEIEDHFVHPNSTRYDLS
jgi:serralysin